MKIRLIITCLAMAGALLQIQTNLQAANSAQFISQDVPATMAAGSTTTVSVTMLNNGSTVWNNTQPYSYSLGSVVTRF